MLLSARPLTVLLAGGSSRAMLASARLSCIFFCRVETSTDMQVDRAHCIVSNWKNCSELTSSSFHWHTTSNSSKSWVNCTQQLSWISVATLRLHYSHVWLSVNKDTCQFGMSDLITLLRKRCCCCCCLVQNIRCVCLELSWARFNVPPNTL